MNDKMISHEEAYKAHCNAIIGQTADEVDKNHDIVKRYMKQQAKEHELLGLYREYYGHIPYSNNPRIKYCEQKIDQLEDKLEEELK